MSKMFYTLDETQVALGLHDDEIQVLIAAGKLREFRDGKRLMFKTDQVDELAAELKGDTEFDGGHNITDEDLEDEDIEMGVMDDDALKNFIANHAMTKIKAETPKPVEPLHEAIVTPPIRPILDRKPIISVQSSRASIPEATEVAVAPRRTFSAIKTASNGAGNSAIDPEGEIREVLKDLRSSVDRLNELVKSANRLGYEVSVEKQTTPYNAFTPFGVKVTKEIR